MHKATLGRRRAYLRTLKQKMGEPLGGAIFDKNDQYKYQVIDSTATRRGREAIPFFDFSLFFKKSP